MPLTLSSTKRPNRLIASPRARRALKRRNLDAAEIHGSGPNGRIIEADVLHFTPPIAPEPVPVAPPSQTLAQLRAEIDASELINWHTRYSPRAEKSDTALSLSDWILLAQIAALRVVPNANVARQNGERIPLTTHPIGFVVKGASEIQAPVLGDIAGLNLLELARIRRELVDEARAGTLNAEDLGAATSLHNAGRGRIDELSPTLAPGYGSVLGVGSLGSRPFVVGETLCVRPTLRLCLVVDTQLVDEASAAQFLEAIIERLEDPALLIL